MSFWTYMLQCADRTLYVGHSDDLERRIAEHQSGLLGGYTSTRLPVHLVWSQNFPTRYEALSAERQIKGWGRAKKLALIRGDWTPISELARSSKEEVRASTSSARTEFGVWAKLIPHPASMSPVVRGLGVQVHRTPDALGLTYRLSSNLSAIALPRPAPPSRTDGLWQHTCFEAFVRAEGGPGYFEFNLSPSGQWAAYRFDAYRAGMEDAPDQEPPSVSIEADRLELAATLRLPELAGKPWHVALSAVIEEKDGTKSWWALRHPSGKPDFHHPDCFALELPPPD